MEPLPLRGISPPDESLFDPPRPPKPFEIPPELRARKLPTEEELLNSSIKIQSAFRGFSTRKYVQRRLVEEENKIKALAAVRIQSHWKGFAQRQTRMQSRTPPTPAEPRAPMDEETQLKSIITIQSLWRGQMVRGQRERFKEELAAQYIMACIIILQRMFRGCLARKRVDRMRGERRRAEAERLIATGRIQRVWRGHKGRVESRERLETRRTTLGPIVVKIQKVFRGHAVRKVLSQQKLQLDSSLSPRSSDSRGERETLLAQHERQRTLMRETHDIQLQECPPESLESLKEKQLQDVTRLQKEQTQQLADLAALGGTVTFKSQVSSFSVPLMRKASSFLIRPHAPGKPRDGQPMRRQGTMTALLPFSRERSESNNSQPKKKSDKENRPRLPPEQVLEIYYAKKTTEHEEKKQLLQEKSDRIRAEWRKRETDRLQQKSAAIKLYLRKHDFGRLNDSLENKGSPRQATHRPVPSDSASMTPPVAKLSVIANQKSVQSIAGLSESQTWRSGKKSPTFMTGIDDDFYADLETVARNSWVEVPLEEVEWKRPSPVKYMDLTSNLSKAKAARRKLLLNHLSSVASRMPWLEADSNEVVIKVGTHVIRRALDGDALTVAYSGFKPRPVEIVCTASGGVPVLIEHSLTNGRTMPIHINIVIHDPDHEMTVLSDVDEWRAMRIAAGRPLEGLHDQGHFLSLGAGEQTTVGFKLHCLDSLKIRARRIHVSLLDDDNVEAAAVVIVVRPKPLEPTRILTLLSTEKRTMKRRIVLPHGSPAVIRVWTELDSIIARPSESSAKENAIDIQGPAVGTTAGYEFLLVLSDDPYMASVREVWRVIMTNDDSQTPRVRSVPAATQRLPLITKKTREVDARIKEDAQLNGLLMGLIQTDKGQSTIEVFENLIDFYEKKVPSKNEMGIKLGGISVGGVPVMSLPSLRVNYESLQQYVLKEEGSQTARSAISQKMDDKKGAATARGPKPLSQFERKFAKHTKGVSEKVWRMYHAAVARRRLAKEQVNSVFDAPYRIVPFVDTVSKPTP